MDSWVVGQISFWYTVYEVKPAVIVDKLVQFWVDLSTPGRGAGESSWYVCMYVCMYVVMEWTGMHAQCKQMDPSCHVVVVVVVLWW